MDIGNGLNGEKAEAIKSCLDIRYQEKYHRDIRRGLRDTAYYDSLELTEFMVIVGTAILTIRYNLE